MQNKYEVLGVVGEGAYGIVYKCRNKNTGEFVAIKKFKESEDEIVKKTMKRELRSLQLLRHENVVEFQDAFKRKGNLFIVFEFIEKNLLELLESQPNGLNPTLIKKLIFQCCKGIKYLHEQNILHRDIKPENLLITNDMRLKLCDFGFARKVNFAEPTTLTDYVATRWYRSPELLLTGGFYGPEVDYWAVGCIMGELADGNPLFPGENETDQLHCIIKVLGNLPEDQINMFYNNPIYAGKKLIDVQKPETLERRYMGKLSKVAINFMKELLQLDPKKRLSDDTVFRHPYFADLIEGERSNKFMAGPNSKRNSNRTEENSKTKEHKFYLPKNLSSGSIKKEEKPGTTPSKYKTGSCNKYDGGGANKNEGVAQTSKWEVGNEGKYETQQHIPNNHSNRTNESSPPKIPITQTTNINIINISNINNTNRDKTSSFAYINEVNNKPEAENNQKMSNGKRGSKNDLNTISMPLNNTMIAFKTISKPKNAPLTKSTGSTGSPQREYNNGHTSNANQKSPTIKEEELFKTFFVDQNDKYNFNINTNFDNKKFAKMNSNKMNYNSNKNCNVIYEDEEYGRMEQPVNQNKNYYSNTNNHNKKKNNYAAFSMYGNFKHKDKGFQLPLINFGKPGAYGGGVYKK